jgi:hypothetical protein
MRNAVGFVVAPPLPPSELNALTEGRQPNNIEGAVQPNPEMFKTVHYSRSD